MLELIAPEATNTRLPLHIVLVITQPVPTGPGHATGLDVGLRQLDTAYPTVSTRVITTLSEHAQLSN